MIKFPPWVRLPDGEKLPEGNWLVLLETRLTRGEGCVHSATSRITRNGQTVIVIAGRFGFDCPRVIAYMQLPPEDLE